MQSIQYLLNTVTEINKRYLELAKLSGENFNIFEILRLNYDELSHSKIIAELLNPNGAHEVGDIFLQIFLDTFGIEDFDTNNATIELEKFIGNIDEEKTTGGRIDIVIQEGTGRRSIFIENKINAEDQLNQLLRYNRYNPSAGLIYLSPWGNDASEFSTGQNPSFKYYRASYAIHIIDWLEKCKKEAVDKPIVRETITQYIYLIKNLTNQSKFKEMEKELNNIMDSNEQTVEAAFIVAENIDSFKLHLFENLFQLQMHELASEFSLEPHFREESPKTQYYRFSFRNNYFPTIELSFSFDQGNFKDMLYGYAFRNDPDSGIPEGLQKIITGYTSQNDWGKAYRWPIYSFMNVHRHWTKESFIAIKNGEMKKLIKSKIEELLDIWPEYNPQKNS